MRWLVIVCALAAVAEARPTGITGASGKSGFICNKCHSGGATPTVSLAGPATIAAGASATYTFTITGGAAVAGGLDAALDDPSLAAGASLATVSAHTQLLAGEVTHTQPNDFASGSLTFQFAVNAPAAARTMTLWVAGNSTNHDGTSSGDKAAGTSLTIAVAAPPAPPDFAGAPPGSDLSLPTDLASPVTNPPPAASDLSVAPTPSGHDLATPAGDPGSAGPPAGAPSRGGCALAPVPTHAPLALFAVVALAVSRSIRRQCARPAPPAPSASAHARARR